VAGVAGVAPVLWWAALEEQALWEVAVQQEQLWARAEPLPRPAAAPQKTAQRAEQVWPVPEV